MSKQTGRYLARSRKAMNLIMFIATGLLLVLLFPKGGKFKYEYSKGKPWMHEVLVAPFDFAIYRTDEELKAQKDSVLANSTAYFNFNPKTGIEQKTKFRQAYSSYWNYFSRKNPKNLNPDLRYIIEQKISSLLDNIYKQGIIELPEEFSTLNKESASIMIVNNNVAEETELNDVFTQKKAYEYLTHNLNVIAEQNNTFSDFDLSEFIKGLNLEEYMSPNLYYDEETSLKMRDTQVNSLSLTEGMVLTGERIIFTGDIVTSHSYKVLESLKKEYESRMGFSSNYIFIILGQILLVALLMVLIYVFLNKFRRAVLLSPTKVSFILFIILLFASVASFTSSFNPDALYIVPFAILPILLKTFFDSKLALFLHSITILLVGFWAPNSFQFVFLSISTGIVALLSLTNMYRRNKLFITSAWIIVTYSIIYTGITLYQEGGFSEMEMKTFMYYAGNGLLVLSTIPLIYFFEKLFGFLSDATLLELSDTNQPLLRKLAELAPGTFQHSMQVANLAEEAIFKIGGNTLLIRAGALYHDIGKMKNPIYFIENLSEAVNPHENLEFEESVRIIVEHVNKGVEIAHNNRLPEPIIDFIRTHHGTSTVHYFYRSFIKKYPNTIVDVDRFSYPGPKPFSREMAVLMMADSVEAASRSLKKYSDTDINELVDIIIANQMAEGQYNEADISLKDIQTVKNTFKRRLKNIYHMRIEYPKKEE